MEISASVTKSLSRYRVIESSGCWEWQGCRCKDGYGQVNLVINGERFYLAHRATYTISKGAIPSGMEIDHECKNRACVNPGHLRAVTHPVNVAAADYTGNHRNARKSHCKRGHSLAGGNLVLKKQGSGTTRQCRQCMSAKARERRAAVHDITIKEI